MELNQEPADDLKRLRELQVHQVELDMLHDSQIPSTEGARFRVTQPLGVAQ